MKHGELGMPHRGPQPYHLPVLYCITNQRCLQYKVTVHTPYGVHACTAAALASITHHCVCLFSRAAAQMSSGSLPRPACSSCPSLVHVP